MSLLQQAIQLLSEAPGNVIYYLATLFALQVVFAIAISQWQRDRSDHMAARMAWAAGAIFLARIGLLLAGVVLQDDLLSAVTAFAPLEQAVHTITAVFITWAFIPRSDRYPRLGYVLLSLALVGIGVMTLSFIQIWQGQAAAGEAYNASRQATIWGVVQLAVLGLGLVFIISRNRFRFSLPLIIVGLLLLAHIAHFWNYPEIITTNTNIAYWIRLGHLVVFPLWAAWSYRHVMTPLLLTQQMQQPAIFQVANSLDLAASVIDSLELEKAVLPAIEMTAKLTNATFVGLALPDEQEESLLRLISNQPQLGEPTARNAPLEHYLSLANWPAFRQALEQQQPVTLMPEGMGARQLHDWYKEIGCDPLGALFVQPLIVDRNTIGLLLLAGLPESEEWGEANRVLAGSLAAYLARVIDNSRSLAMADQQLPTRLLEPDAALSGRILGLEEDRDRIKAELDITISRMQQAEIRAATANKQARDLAATLNEIEDISRDEQVEALKIEIESLRESLIEAEEAMALAAAGEGELSTEWVMQTITRYSGDLEEAQAQIQLLEKELSLQEDGPVNEVVASLVQDLRTPMTSITGYTEMLLAERIGILGVKQRDFVQRVQANTSRMGTLLDQLVQYTTGVETFVSLEDAASVDMEEVLETAVSSVLTQVREKNLRLEMNIAPELPLLSIDRKALHQIMTSLLGNACQSSPNNGQVSVVVRTDGLTEDQEQTSNNGHTERFQFMHLAVTDNGGGIHVKDMVRVFVPQYDADSPLIAGLGDTGAALSVARSLAEAHGGRLWVDSIIGAGSTFSALFPLSLESLRNGKTAVSENGEGAD